MGKKILNRVIFIFFSTLVILSCKSGPDSSRWDTAQPHESAPLGIEYPEETEETEAAPHVTGQPSGSLAEEIRFLTESGVLSMMLNALELIRTNNLSGVDFGRMMTGVNVLLIKLVYPDSLARLPSIDLPLTSNYTRIIREAERGSYVRPSSSSVDFLEHILPFLSVNDQTEASVLQSIMRDIEKAESLRLNSVFPPYFRGLIHERNGQYVQAEAAYRQAYGISEECFPAQIGMARVRRLAGAPREATDILSDLVISHPDSTQIKRERAISFYENKDWSRALPAVNELLQSDPRDGDLLLIKAFILIEQGQFSQANAALDSYAPINPNNRQYLFLRAKVQAEGNRNRDSALNYLRSIIRANPNDTEALVYAADLLMESQRPADQIEGREMLSRLRQSSGGSSVEVLSLSLRDAIVRERWQEAQGYLNSILSSRRTVQDLTDAFYVERGLGNHARALTYARELYDRDNFNHDYSVIYISALIGAGRRDEASRLIEGRLNSAGTSQIKSRYFYLRSRLQTNQESALSDLRSSLFEDPRNLDALIATFELYHNRREERRAVYYLRQALAIAPEHPVLKRYEREYASLLGRN